MSRTVKAGSPATASGSGISDGQPPPFGSISDYIADLCGSMIRLAAAEKLDMLVYLLGMARLEAIQVSQRRAAQSSPAGTDLQP